MTRTVAERFWEKVNKNGPVPPNRPELGPCWIWEASIHPNGYGQFCFKGRQRRSHHVAVFLAKGEMPKGYRVCHHCDIRACVRETHFFYGTQKENIADGIRKGRVHPWLHRKINAKCPLGHELVGSNLRFATKLYKGVSKRIRRGCSLCAKNRRIISKLKGDKHE